MDTRLTVDFLNQLKKLPADAQRIFEKQQAVFAHDWLDSRLHLKRLKEFQGVYSFRITRRYRALFYIKGESAVLFAIGHRKDVYRK